MGHLYVCIRFREDLNGSVATRVLEGTQPFLKPKMAGAIESNVQITKPAAGRHINSREKTRLQTGFCLAFAPYSSDYPLVIRNDDVRASAVPPPKKKFAIGPVPQQMSLPPSPPEKKYNPVFYFGHHGDMCNMWHMYIKVWNILQLEIGDFNQKWRRTQLLLKIQRQICHFTAALQKETLIWYWHFEKINVIQEMGIEFLEAEPSDDYLR